MDFYFKAFCWYVHFLITSVTWEVNFSGVLSMFMPNIFIISSDFILIPSHWKSVSVSLLWFYGMLWHLSAFGCSYTMWLLILYTWTSLMVSCWGWVRALVFHTINIFLVYKISVESKLTFFCSLDGTEIIILYQAIGGAKIKLTLGDTIIS